MFCALIYVKKGESQLLCMKSFSVVWKITTKKESIWQYKKIITLLNLVGNYLTNFWLKTIKGIIYRGSNKSVNEIWAGVDYLIIKLGSIIHAFTLLFTNLTQQLINFSCVIWVTFYYIQQQVYWHTKQTFNFLFMNIIGKLMELKRLVKNVKKKQLSKIVGFVEKKKEKKNL